MVGDVYDTIKRSPRTFDVILLTTTAGVVIGLIPFLPGHSTSAIEARIRSGRGIVT